MITLCSLGHKISQADQKALNHYLLVTPKQWALDALKGMINKSVKTILRDYLQKYKDTQSGNISADIAVLIPAIIAMPTFIPYNVQTPSPVIVERDQLANTEIWENGFDIQDYEEAALNAYYSDPEEMLRWFMENKVYQRKKAVVKEAEAIMINDPEVTEIPARQDAMIDLYTSDVNYKNRAQREAESQL